MYQSGVSPEEIPAKIGKHCREKIQYFLKKEYGEEVSVSTIHRILNEKYRLKKRWRSNEKRGAVFKGSKPQEMVQVDMVDFGSIYAFTFEFGEI